MQDWGVQNLRLEVEEALRTQDKLHAPAHARGQQAVNPYRGLTSAMRADADGEKFLQAGHSLKALTQAGIYRGNNTYGRRRPAWMMAGITCASEGRLYKATKPCAAASSIAQGALPFAP